MALTTSGSTGNDDVARRVSPAGVTRQGRIANESAVANSAGAQNSYGDAFIDGGTLGQASKAGDVRSAASVSGEGTGFPGIGDGDYYPDSGGSTAAAKGSANVVKRDASVKGGQAGGPVASPTSEAFDHGSSPGFPFNVPSPRQT